VYLRKINASFFLKPRVLITNSEVTLVSFIELPHGHLVEMFVREKSATETSGFWGAVAKEEFFYGMTSNISEHCSSKCVSKSY
jgi:hypothetical protein